MPVLVTKAPDRRFDLGQALRAAAQARGISRLRLVAEIVRMQLGRQRLGSDEYFLYGAHRAKLGPEDRSEFLGHDLMDRMNHALGPKGQELAGLTADKLLMDMVLTRAGVPVAPIRAVAVTVEAKAPYPVLSDPSSLARFLTETPLPVFGKPVHGSMSEGAISLIGRQGSSLELGDGKRVDAADLAAEILASYPQGYLFQELMVPHPGLARIVGPVLGSVRVVTVRAGRKIVPLYAILKMPGAGQMVDDIASFVNTMCAVDYHTGRIVRGQDPRRLGGNDLIANPVTGVALAGTELPMWKEVMALALSVHELLHRQGMVGGDYAITAAGPLVTEVNASPMHSLYQKCFARGFWNADIAPIMTEALAGFGHRSRSRSIPFP